MSKGLTYLTLKNNKFSLFLVVIVLILGLFNYSIMPRQEVADVSPPLAQIIAIYPGASPETIERLITSEIESEVSEITFSIIVAFCSQLTYLFSIILTSLFWKIFFLINIAHSNLIY